ncbi:MAG: hypothetical protein AB1567_12055 [bacterium]
MTTQIKSKEGIMPILNEVFGKDDTFQIEVLPKQIIIQKAEEDVIKKTKGKIKNLDRKTITMIAESEEFCGY